LTATATATKPLRCCADSPGMLSFQRLDVYQRSIDFFALAIELPNPPRGHSELGDQLRRAARSIPANIAEAAGRTSKVDGARFYAIARGSAMECAAHVDCYRKLGAIDENRYNTAVALLESIVAMLTKLCR
jgi:four helix bundle protein